MNTLAPTFFSDIDSESIAQVVAVTEEFPAPPAILSKILELTSDPSTPVGMVSRAVSSEAALAAKLLKISNSAFYGRSRNIATIHDAIVMLGFHVVRSMVVATATHGMFHADGELLEMRQRLWRHSLAAALFSKKLAAQGRQFNSEEAFLAGLLHDVGKLVLLVRFPHKLARVYLHPGGAECDFLLHERRTFGFTHEHAGAMLLDRWLLPESLVQAAGMHHRGAGLDHLAGIVAAANAFVAAHGYGVHAPTPEMAALLESLDLAPLAENFQQEFEEYQALFDTP